MSCPCRPFHESARLWSAGFEKIFHRSASRQDNGAKVRVAHIHTSTGAGVAMVEPCLELARFGTICFVCVLAPRRDCSSDLVDGLWLCKKST